jgi:hypothetical protein
MAREQITTRTGTSTTTARTGTPHSPTHIRIAGVWELWLGDIVVFVALWILGWWSAREYIGTSLFAWGDHPGQFMRFWYPLTQAMPASGHWLWGVISWNPTWYAGYPEIQFYPPGTTLLGILLHYVTLGQLSPERVYNLIPAIAFVLPLFTCYLFLRYALAPLGRLPSALAGITAGLLALSLKPMWGGIDGVTIGLMGERLAFGFAPLVLLAGWWLVEKPSMRRLAIASFLLATLVLLHPFHAPALVVAIALYATTRVAWRQHITDHTVLSTIWRQASWLAAWMLLAIALVAWWVVPLLAHYTPYAAALVRATTDQVISWFDAGRIEWLWLAGLMALMLLAHGNPRIRGTVGVLALLAPLLVAGILFNDQVLVARFNITVLDPIRFIAEYYLALILVVGCAVGAITSGFLWRIRWLATLCTVVVLVTLQPYVVMAWDGLQAHTQVSQAWKLDVMQRHPAFDGFWDALRNDPTSGRILFVSNYLHLIEDDGSVTPTTVQSLTPYLIGREIVGGTFSHWSPIARWLWVGDARATLLPAQVESSDSRQLFGKAWSELSAGEIADNLTKLNVTTIVAGPNDQSAIALFDASPHFTRYWQNETFTLFHLVSNPGGWIAADDASVELVERTPLRWTIRVDSSAPGATMLLKMSHFPLWQARTGSDTPPIRATIEGLQAVTLPEGAPYTVEIEYRPGRWEWSGLMISVLGLLALAALLWPRRAT